jgi:hypothetical protein
MPRPPTLTALHLADPPERWEALGFEVQDGHVDLGGVRLHLGGAGRGITAWTISGVDTDVDGLASAASSGPQQAIPHPNRAIGIDHVVVVSPDFDRTASALESNGMPLRRIRDAGGFRQGFRRLGPAILELVETRDSDAEQPARFWGLVVTIEDLEGLKTRLGDLLGEIHPAVQPGRQIATLRRAAGLREAVAFMTPESP